MTVITKDTIKQTIAEHKNTNTFRPTSSPTSHAPIEWDLEKLEESLIYSAAHHEFRSFETFTESNTSFITRFLDQRGITLPDDALQLMLVKSFEEGNRQRIQNEQERNRRSAEATIADLRLYMYKRPDITLEELLTSKTITFYNRLHLSADVPTPICEILFRQALAGEDFSYPEEADDQQEETIKEENESTTSPSILDDVVAGTIGVFNPGEKTLGDTSVSEPQETVREQEAPASTRVIPDEAILRVSREHDNERDTLTLCQYLRTLYPNVTNKDLTRCVFSWAHRKTGTREEPTARIEVSTVKETTSSTEALQTPVEVPTASETVEAPKNVDKLTQAIPSTLSERKLDYMRTCNAAWMERLITLPYSARWLAIVIVYYAGKDPHHVAVLSHQHMERFGLDKNTTRRALKELEDAAVVTVIRNDHSSPRAILPPEAFPPR